MLLFQLDVASQLVGLDGRCPEVGSSHREDATTPTQTKSYQITGSDTSHTVTFDASDGLSR